MQTPISLPQSTVAMDADWNLKKGQRDRMGVRRRGPVADSKPSGRQGGKEVTELPGGPDVARETGIGPKLPWNPYGKPDLKYI